MKMATKKEREKNTTATATAAPTTTLTNEQTSKVLIRSYNTCIRCGREKKVCVPFAHIDSTTQPNAIQTQYDLFISLGFINLMRNENDFLPKHRSLYWYFEKGMWMWWLLYVVASNSIEIITNNQIFLAKSHFIGEEYLNNKTFVRIFISFLIHGASDAGSVYLWFTLVY